MSASIAYQKLGHGESLVQKGIPPINGTMHEISKLRPYRVCLEQNTRYYKQIFAYDLQDLIIKGTLPENPDGWICKFLLSNQIEFPQLKPDPTYFLFLHISVSSKAFWEYS